VLAQSSLFDSTQSQLQHNMKRLGVVSKRAGGCHMLFLLLFVVALVVGLYVMSKLFRVGRSVFGHPR
jgi:hypothetical protein